MKPRVFISYVHENGDLVSKLAAELTRHGVDVWYDKRSLNPGDWWRQEIRGAIQRGDFFIACFSTAYVARTTSYMNEELTLAIDELRKHPHHRKWFIPVLLDDCEIPDRDIGGGRRLRDLHAADICRDWPAGVAAILSVVKPDVTPGPDTPAVISAPSPGTADTYRDEQLLTEQQRRQRSTVVMRELGIAEDHRSRLPPHARGWWLEACAALFAVSFACEWYVARLATEVFLELTYVMRLNVAFTFASIGTILGVFTGQLLHRRRAAGDHSLVDNLLLGIVVVAGVLFVTAENGLILAYFSVFNELVVGNYDRHLSVTSTAVTAAAVAGMLIALVAAYRRESVDAARTRWSIRRLRKEAVATGAMERPRPFRVSRRTFLTAAYALGAVLVVSAAAWYRGSSARSGSGPPSAVVSGTDRPCAIAGAERSLLSKDAPPPNVELLVASGRSIPPRRWPLYRAMSVGVIRCLPGNATLTIRAITARSLTEAPVFLATVPSDQNPLRAAAEVGKFRQSAEAAVDNLPRRDAVQEGADPLGAMQAAGVDFGRARPAAGRLVIVAIFDGWSRTAELDFVHRGTPTIATVRAMLHDDALPYLSEVNVLIAGLTAGDGTSRLSPKTAAGLCRVWATIVGMTQGKLEICVPALPGIAAP